MAYGSEKKCLARLEDVTDSLKAVAIASEILNLHLQNENRKTFGHDGTNQ